MKKLLLIITIALAAFHVQASDMDYSRDSLFMCITGPDGDTSVRHERCLQLPHLLGDARQHAADPSLPEITRRQPIHRRLVLQVLPPGQRRHRFRLRGQGRSLRRNLFAFLGAK